MEKKELANDVPSDVAEAKSDTTEKSAEQNEVHDVLLADNSAESLNVEATDANYNSGADAKQQKDNCEENVLDGLDQETVDAKNNSTEKPKKLSKKKLVLIIIASVLIVAIVVTALCLKFLLFNDPVYAVDLDAVKAQTPIFDDEFDTFNDLVWQKEVYYYYACLGTKANGEPCDKVTASIPTVCETCQNSDQSKYTKQGRAPRRGGYWTEDSVFVENGNLVIRTHKDKESGKWFTGAVNSLGTATPENLASGKELGLKRTYGYFEINCKLPKGYGIWSAFWFMGLQYGNIDDKDASKYGSEIDVFEAPCWPSNRVQQAVHVGAYGKNSYSSSANLRWMMEKYTDLYDTYHTYGLYWNEDIYKFYVDGVCRWTTHMKNNVSKVDEYMMISVEIGGSDGLPNDNPWKFVGGKLIDRNPEGDNFQSDFIIDSVKIWNVL